MSLVPFPPVFVPAVFFSRLHHPRAPQRTSGATMLTVGFGVSDAEALRQLSPFDYREAVRAWSAGERAAAIEDMTDTEAVDLLRVLSSFDRKETLMAINNTAKRISVLQASTEHCVPGSRSELAGVSRGPAGGDGGRDVQDCLCRGTTPISNA